MRFPANTAFKIDRYDRIDSNGDMVPCTLFTCRSGVLPMISTEIPQSFTDTDLENAAQIIHAWISKRVNAEDLKCQFVNIKRKQFLGWPDPDNPEGWVKILYIVEAVRT